MANYHKKQLHKQKQIQYFEIRWDRGRRSLKEILKLGNNDPRFPIRYWQRTYMSSRKRIAKRQTNSRLRQCYRVEVRKKDLDEIEVPRQGNYKKIYDWWEID